MEGSDDSRPVAGSSCVPDNSDIDRNDLLFDIMRLPMTQFQAFCHGIQNNMSPDELSKIMASWTEERFKKNLSQTMTALEERVNLLSSSYHTRKQQNDTQDNVQLAPETKEVVTTVLDSMNTAAPDDPNAGGKQQFIGYLQGTVEKMKDLTKVFKTERKQPKNLNITPAVVESLSELLAVPGKDGNFPCKSSPASPTESSTRLCTTDAIIRASRSVSSILMTPVGSSTQQRGHKSPSMASVRSVHDNAWGIVDTIVTDIEELYDSLDPKEVEKLQSQSLPTQEESNATQKKVKGKFHSILCSAQVKLRWAFSRHQSRDIMPDSTPPDTCHDGIQLKDGSDIQSRAEGLPVEKQKEQEGPVPPSTDTQTPDKHVGLSDSSVSDKPTDESAVQRRANADLQSSMEMADTETSNNTALSSENKEAVSSPASQPEEKDKKHGVRKQLKIFFPKDKVSRLKLSKVSPSVQSTPKGTLDESTLFGIAESMDTSPVQTQDTATTDAAQPHVLPSQEPPQALDTYEKSGSMPTSVSQDQGNDPTAITESSDKEVHRASLGKTLKNIFAKGTRYSLTKEAEACEPLEQSTPEFEKVALHSDTADTKLAGEYTELDSTLTHTTTESAPGLDVNSQEGSSVLPASTTEEVIEDVIPTDNQKTMREKFKTLFSKSPKPLIATETCEATEQQISTPEETAVEVCASEPESYPPCEAAASSHVDKEESSAEDASEVEQTSKLAATTLDEETVSTDTTPSTKSKLLSVGGKLKTLFAMSPKPIDVAPAMQADESVPEPAASLAETLDAAATPDTETVLQPPENTLPEASLPEDISEAEQTSEAAATLDEDTVSTETTSDTQSKRLSVGVKLKALFALSPKTVDVGPALQADETDPEPAASLAETLDAAATPDTETVLEPPENTLPEASLPKDTSEAEQTSEAAATLDEDTVSTETTSDTKSTRLSVGGKLKALFALSPKTVDVGPALQMDETVTETVVSPIVEIVEVASVPDSEEAPMHLVETLPEVSLPQDTYEESSEAAATLDEDTISTETTSDTKSNRLSVGGKLKALFALSPKTVDVGPALQMDKVDPVPAETLDVAAAPDDKAATLPPVATLIEASSPDEACEDQGASDGVTSLDEETTVPTETKSPRPSVGVKLKTLFVWSPKPVHVEPAMQADETIPEEAASSVETQAFVSDPDAEAAQLSPVGMLPEPSPHDDIHKVEGSTEAVMELDEKPQTQLQSVPTESRPDTKSKTMSQKLKILFARPLKPVDEEPAMQADDISSASICETSPQPPMRTPSASNGMRPSSDTAISSTKADHLSSVKDTPPEASVKKNTTSTANAKAFHTMSEAALALKGVTDRMLLQERDDASAAASLHRLMSRDVLRPFTDDLVNRVYGYLSAIGSSAPCIEPVRLVTESGVLTTTTTTATTTTTGDLQRDLVVKRDSDVTRAFAEGSVKAMVKQLLERLLPLPKESDTSGNDVLNMVTYMIAKEAVKTITLDHLTLQREETDTESSYTDSESSGSGEDSEVTSVTSDTSATSVTSADDSSSSSDDEDDLEMKTDHQNTQKKTIFSIMRVFNAFKSSSITPK